MSSRRGWIHIQVVLIVSYDRELISIAHHRRRSRDSFSLKDMFVVTEYFCVLGEVFRVVVWV
jgi:hypothetical protein